MAKTMPARLLVIDQDTRYGEWLKHHLGVICTDCPVSVLPLSEFDRWSEELEGRDCDVLMLGASFGTSPEDPQAQGLELLRRLREKPYFPAVIAVAEDGNELTAVRAMQLGAVDYLPKRLLTPERLKTSVRLALRMIEKRVARRIASLAYTSDAPDTADTKSSTRDTKSNTGKRATLAARAASVAAAASVTSEAVVPDAAVPKAGAAGDGVAGADASAGVGAQADAGDGAGVNAGVGAEASAGDGAKANAAGANADADADARAAAGAGSKETEPAGGAGAEAGSAAEAASGPAKQTRDFPTPVPPARAPGGEFMPADFIPGYTIHATIGESEKAAVYVATSAALSENVALKVSKTLRDEAAGRQFLEREYTAILAIRNPAVVRIFDYGIHAGYEYLVMEYLPRGDLKARMQQSLTEEEALRYLCQITAALHVVHSAGLIHRDLKPPNVMLRENGDVALIDFGLARALDGSTPSTRTGVLRGSPYYMSPEQALGEVLDARSDFYSLGIMFFEMLTGKRPYTGGSAMDVLQQHVNAPIPMLPKALAHHEPVLLKLMAKSREDRFATAEDILAALGSHIDRMDATRDVDVEVESSAA
jgi:DNA-binding NarL/FixJ family response regulator